MHLIKPFGFDLDDKKLRRAGLDYHEFAGIFTYDNWQDFVKTHENHRVFGISTKASRHYSEVKYRPGDFLIFGPETRGLPETVRNTLGTENLLRIPMLPGSRSLNLSNAAAVVVYEAWRQQGFMGGS